MPFVGPQEWMIILLIVILLFGASKVPELARSIGKAKGAFKKGLEDGEKEEEKPATKES